MLADSQVHREIIKRYLSLNRDTLITFLSFVVIVACLYLSCMSSVMILCYGSILNKFLTLTLNHPVLEWVGWCVCGGELE